MRKETSPKPVSRTPLTAVQLRDDGYLSSYTIHGQPVARTQGQLGEIRLYPAGEIVGFVVEKFHRQRAFIFSTCNGEGTHKLPGVFPEVRLLVETRSTRKTRQLLQYIDYAVHKQIMLNKLPEEFFVRLNILLEERTQGSQDFKSLLMRWAS